MYRSLSGCVDASQWISVCPGNDIEAVGRAHDQWTWAIAYLSSWGTMWIYSPTHDHIWSMSHYELIEESLIDPVPNLCMMLALVRVVEDILLTSRKSKKRIGGVHYGGCCGSRCSSGTYSASSCSLGFAAALGTASISDVMTPLCEHTAYKIVFKCLNTSCIDM